MRKKNNTNNNKSKKYRKKQQLKTKRGFHLRNRHRRVPPLLRKAGYLQTPRRKLPVRVHQLIRQQQGGWCARVVAGKVRAKRHLANLLSFINAVKNETRGDVLFGRGWVEEGVTSEAIRYTRYRYTASIRNNL